MLLLPYNMELIVFNLKSTNNSKTVFYIKNLWKKSLPLTRFFEIAKNTGTKLKMNTVCKDNK